MKALRVLVIVLLVAAPPGAAAAPPANPNASAKAKQVLAYLQSLPQKAANKVLSGQNAQVGPKAPTGYTDFVEKLQQQTGKWVALVGVDYGYETIAADIKTVNQVAKQHWNKGGLVTVSHHLANPFTGGDAWDTSGVDLTKLITTGTPENTKWIGWLDEIATGLAELRDAGVVVLWRPFHEMNGDWFWWSYKGNDWAPQADFVALWKHMFNYFTSTKQLNNLLWVYAPNAQLGPDSAKPTTHYYPGNAFVDVVGLDYYRDTLDELDAYSSYSSLAALGKPVAITEIGSKSQRDGSFDNMLIINGIKSKAPKVVWWLNWHSWPGASVALVDCKNAGALLADPWVITLDEIALGGTPDGGGPPVDAGAKDGPGPSSDGSVPAVDGAAPGDTTAPPGKDGDDGCGCRMDRRPCGAAGVVLLLVALGLGWRRRR